MVASEVDVTSPSDLFHINSNNINIIIYTVWKEVCREMQDPGTPYNDFLYKLTQDVRRKGFTARFWDLCESVRHDNDLALSVKTFMRGADVLSLVGGTDTTYARLPRC